MNTLKNFDGYSVGLTALISAEHTPRPPNELGGRLRVAAFTYEDPAVTTDGDHIAVALLPKGAAILHIHLAWEAMGVNADLDLGLFTTSGVEIDDDAFGTLDVHDAGTSNIYPVVDPGTVYTTDQQAVLTLTAETANWAAAKYVKGYVVYVVNS